MECTCTHSKKSLAFGLLWLGGWQIFYLFWFKQACYMALNKSKTKWNFKMIISRKTLDTYPNITKKFLQNLSFLVKKLCLVILFKIKTNKMELPDEHLVKSSK